MLVREDSVEMVVVMDSVPGVEEKVFHMSVLRLSVQDAALAAAKQKASEIAEEGGLTADEIHQQVEEAAVEAKDLYLRGRGMSTDLTFGPTIDQAVRLALGQAY